ncbi:MAG: AraC family transcriptional regulator [Saprospiraceae bacterium]
MENSIHLELFEYKSNLLNPESVFEKNWIHLLFCLGAEVSFKFGPVYTRNLKPNKAFIIFDPDRNLEYHSVFAESSQLCLIKISLNNLHNLFVPDVDQSPLFTGLNLNQKFYEERDIPQEVLTVIHQLFEIKLHENSKRLYTHAKAIEILSLFFTINKPDVEACPFLNNEHIIRKLKNAKTILLSNFRDPSKLPEIAKQVGLNEYQLKVGFKEIYGNSPYQYVLDYKLEIARQLLSKQEMQVNEVADKIGYTNVSHFITAFKRKYGITPKKYKV